jgi:cell growth-regulating nucleolar protein
MGWQSCISEDQKYQGKLYREKKKGQHQKKDSGHQDNSQALVTRKAHVEDAPDAETGAVAIVDAPPRAPSPPPASRSLGYEEKPALPPVNVFDFLDPSATPNASHVDHNPVDESRMIEDSQPPAYEEHPSATQADPMKFQVHDDDHYNQNGFAYGGGAVMPTQERHEPFYDTREVQPNPNFTTPAPKTKHSRTKSRDKDLDTTAKKTDRKRKRNSPAELDMSLVHAQQDRDVMMSDAPPVLHSGLTGGLNRLLTRPEFPPSPELSGDYVENSPLSPMKRAKQGTSKALVRAQREWEIQQEKERKAGAREETQREKEARKEKERGRDRERKERKVSSALVKIKPKKRRDDSARAARRHREADHEGHRISRFWVSVTGAGG